MHKITSVAYFVKLPNQSSKCMTYLPNKARHWDIINFKTKWYNEGKLTKALRCRTIYYIGPKMILLTSNIKSCAATESPPQWYRLIETLYKNLFKVQRLWLTAIQLLLHLGEHFTRSRILSWLISGPNFLFLPSVKEWILFIFVLFTNVNQH